MRILPSIRFNFIGSLDIFLWILVLLSSCQNNTSEPSTLSGKWINVLDRSDVNEIWFYGHELKWFQSQTNTIHHRKYKLRNGQLFIYELDGITASDFPQSGDLQIKSEDCFWLSSKPQEVLVFQNTAERVDSNSFAQLELNEFRKTIADLNAKGAFSSRTVARCGDYDLFCGDSGYKFKLSEKGKLIALQNKEDDSRFLILDHKYGDKLDKYAAGSAIFGEYNLSLKTLLDEDYFERNKLFQASGQHVIIDSALYSHHVDSLMAQYFAFSLNQNEKDNLLQFLINY